MDENERILKVRNVFIGVWFLSAFVICLFLLENMMLCWVIFPAGLVLYVFLEIAVVHLVREAQEGLDILTGNRPPKKHQPSESTPYPPNWASIRDAVLRRDRYRCGNCGSTHDLHVHHIVPLSKEGTNAMTNLRTLCYTCHKKIHPRYPRIR